MNELSAVPDEKAQEADEGDAGCGAHARCHRKGEASPGRGTGTVSPCPASEHGPEAVASAVGKRDL